MLRLSAGKATHPGAQQAWRGQAGEPDLAWLPPASRRLRDPQHTWAVPSSALVALARRLTQDWHRGRHAVTPTQGGRDAVPQP
ncbi:MAG TPA: hypothetical protein VFL69_07810 [Marmoricola sp.]|nr:hypothetical protein [Marmoricola sp.]